MTVYLAKGFRDEHGNSMRGEDGKATDNIYITTTTSKDKSKYKFFNNLSQAKSYDDVLTRNGINGTTTRDEVLKYYRRCDSLSQVYPEPKKVFIIPFAPVRLTKTGDGIGIEAVNPLDPLGLFD